MVFIKFVLVFKILLGEECLGFLEGRILEMGGF